MTDSHKNSPSDAGVDLGPEAATSSKEKNVLPGNFSVPTAYNRNNEFKKPSIDKRIGAELEKYKAGDPLVYAKSKESEAPALVPVLSKPEGNVIKRTILIKYLGTTKDVGEQMNQIIVFLRHLGSVRGRIQYRAGWFEYTFLSVRELNNLYDLTPPHENVLWMDFKSGTGIKFIPKLDDN